ncbi:hypothetical protein [Mesorhizobium loti]|uniref:hypothetical protein n=1 Tax=Rhizobium loti TaxID=381 RepID=UPI0011B63209|nr:hypothetical protein [Mesorhizobium loti]
MNPPNIICENALAKSFFERCAESLPKFHNPFIGALYDWQTLLTGVFALVGSFESSRSLVAASRASAISGEIIWSRLYFPVVYPSQRDRRSSAKRSAKSTYRSQICTYYQCPKHSDYRPSSASALASSINRLGEAEIAPNIGQMIGQLWALS